MWKAQARLKGITALKSSIQIAQSHYNVIIHCSPSWQCAIDRILVIRFHYSLWGECGTFIDIDALKAKSDNQTTCTEYMETDEDKYNRLWCIPFSKQAFSVFFFSAQLAKEVFLGHKLKCRGLAFHRFPVVWFPLSACCFAHNLLTSLRHESWTFIIEIDLRTEKILLYNLTWKQSDK